ncbi:hypothetical protein C4900_10790 [Acidiferrobacter thiooxydans]|uniref:Uncharacterized protein n=1 Tax=Acidiferrobacter thiooxydans TaxID=163359 RepID=A0A1C2FXC8_9GAMM|nr:hypothetical protein C4900_10790 [Acidiferrobacter thiooxydans]
MAPEVDAGRFRGDLCCRINTLTIRLPCLRERSDFDRPAAACIGRGAPGRGIILSDTLMRAFRATTGPGTSVGWLARRAQHAFFWILREGS